MKQPVERRLAAILAADVASYSRLMGVDEEGTHERLKAHIGQLVNPKIKEHRGRTVKNTGDGLLAEFSSVVDAMRCAALSNCSERWVTAMRKQPRTNASPSGLGSTSET
jgi:class 3 adenylate cyclase